MALRAGCWSARRCRASICKKEAPAPFEAREPPLTAGKCRAEKRTGRGGPSPGRCQAKENDTSSRSML